MLLSTKVTFVGQKYFCQDKSTYVRQKEILLDISTFIDKSTFVGYRWHNHSPNVTLLSTEVLLSDKCLFGLDKSIFVQQKILFSNKSCLIVKTEITLVEKSKFWGQKLLWSTKVTSVLTNVSSVSKSTDVTNGASYSRAFYIFSNVLCHADCIRHVSLYHFMMLSFA